MFGRSIPQLKLTRERSVPASLGGGGGGGGGGDLKIQPVKSNFTTPSVSYDHAENSESIHLHHQSHSAGVLRPIVLRPVLPRQSRSELSRCDLFVSGEKSNLLCPRLHSLDSTDFEVHSPMNIESIRKKYTSVQSIDAPHSSSKARRQSTSQPHTLEEANKHLAVALEQIEKERLTASSALEKEAASRGMLDMKRRFVRGVGHEIRTPLNVVYSGLQVLESRLEGVADMEIFEILSEIKRSCCDAVEMMDDLLSYEKMENQLLQIDRSAVDIHAFIQSALRPFAVQGKLHDISITYCDTSGDSDSPAPMVEADSHKLGQVVRNLLSNAVKFSKQGGNIDVRVFWKESSTSSDLFAEHGWMRVEVSDDGPGISEENIKKLFDTIVQFKPKELQNGGGSGIGLWVAKGIIDLHKGTIGVVSLGEGFGSTFYFELPLMKSEYVPIVDAPVSLKVSYKNISPKSSLKKHMPLMNTTPINNFNESKLKILIVDDAPLIRKMLKRLLFDRCYTMDEACDGQEAVDKVALSLSQDYHPYDLVFMDGQMPVMSGCSATKLIRAKGYKGKVFGLTGDGLADAVSEFITSGADLVMIKPVSVEELHRAIEGIQRVNLDK